MSVFDSDPCHHIICDERAAIEAMMERSNLKPPLSPDDLPKFSSGEYKLDTMTKNYIHQNLEYQYAVVESSSDAYKLEREIRQGNGFKLKPSFRRSGYLVQLMLTGYSINILVSIYPVVAANSTGINSF